MDLNSSSLPSVEENAKEASSVKEMAEAFAVEKKGYLVPSRFLHSLFVNYLLSGRIRAPQSADLLELIQTFKQGAKHDRRALQSKFKSWSKRMILRESDKALTLASCGKVIIPLEDCGKLVLSIHLSRIKCHLSAEEVVSQIRKHYTWSRKDFGMDWDIVVDAIRKGCKNLMCQLMCDRYYKQTVTDDSLGKPEVPPYHEDNTTESSETSAAVEVKSVSDCQTYKNTSMPQARCSSQEANSVTVLLTTEKSLNICDRQDMALSHSGNNTSTASAVSPAENKDAMGEPHGDSRFGSASGIQIIPISAASTNALMQVSPQETITVSKPCIQSSSPLRLYIPFAPRVTAGNVPFTKTYSHILPKSKPPVPEKQSQFANKKLEPSAIAKVTIRPTTPDLTQGKSFLWKTILEGNRVKSAMKKVATFENSCSVTLAQGRNTSLKSKQDKVSYEKRIEHEAKRLLMSSKPKISLERDQSCPSDMQTTVLQCFPCKVREMKSRAVQTSPPEKQTWKRKILQVPHKGGKKMMSVNEDGCSDAKKDYSNKSVFFIIKKNALVQSKQELSDFQASNPETRMLCEKSSMKVAIPLKRNACETAKTSPYHDNSTTNSNRRKKPRKSTPFKSVTTTDRVFSSSNKETVSTLRKSQRETKKSNISGNDMTCEINESSSQNSTEFDFKKGQPTKDENCTVDLLKDEETMDVTMGKIVEQAVTMKSTFRQVLASEGRGKSIDVLKSKIMACERLIKKLKTNPAIMDSSSEGNWGLLPSSEGSILSSFMKMATKEG